MTINDELTMRPRSRFRVRRLYCAAVRSKAAGVVVGRAGPFLAQLTAPAATRNLLMGVSVNGSF